MTQLEQQPGWEKFREHRQLLMCWPKVVGASNSSHTRPLYINRQVLWVATSTSARAQELSFQRYALLKKLNKQLSFTLKDIRFSSSQWHQAPVQVNPELNIFSISDKYKLLASSPASKALSKEQKKGKKTTSVTKAKAAVECCLETIRQNSLLFSSCPKCKVSTPEEEIKRWNSCYHCVAQKWSQEYRPPTFPEV